MTLVLTFALFSPGGKALGALLGLFANSGLPRRLGRLCVGVPPNQTELVVAALKNRKVPVGYFLFGGEQHGFRKAENIKRPLDAELYFYVALVLRSGLHF